MIGMGNDIFMYHYIYYMQLYMYAPHIYICIYILLKRKKSFEESQMENFTKSNIISLP